MCVNIKFWRFRDFWKGYAKHWDVGKAMPIVSTSADGYTTLRLDSWPGLDCCVIGCDVNVDGLWHYHRDSRRDR